MEKPTILIGAAVFVEQNGCILLGKRKNTYGAGDWGLPGGHLEYGEKLIDCAIRELKEEVGIEAGPQQMTLSALVDDPRADQHYVHVAFTLSDVGGEPRLMEPEKCEEWKFFPVQDLPTNIFIGHKRIIETYKRQTIYLK